MEGYCKRGDKCNFYHPPKEKEPEVFVKKNDKNAKKKKQFAEKV